MKKNISFIALIIIVLLLFSSFVVSCEMKNNEDIINHDIVMGNRIFSGEIAIYKISRDKFDVFLKNPSYDILKENVLSSSVYPQAGEWYITHNNIRFPIKNQLIEFMGDQSKLQEYISENGVNEAVESMAILDCPNTPLTMWIQTTNQNIYITINEDPKDDIYVFRFYKESDFTEKYISRDGKLIIKGVEIPTEYAPKIFHDYADIPLITAIKALGAEIKQKDETNTYITINNETYKLNISKRTLYGKDKENLLYSKDGGVIFVYRYDSELMVDSSTFSYILYKMGVRITLEINSAQNAVIIENE